MEWLVGLILVIVVIVIVKWILLNLPWIVLVAGVPSLAGFLVSQWTGGKLTNGSLIGFGINYGVITGIIIFLIALFISAAIHDARHPSEKPRSQPRSQTYQIAHTLQFIILKLLGR